MHTLSDKQWETLRKIALGDGTGIDGRTTASLVKRGLLHPQGVWFAVTGAGISLLKSTLPEKYQVGYTFAEGYQAYGAYLDNTDTPPQPECPNITAQRLADEARARVQAKRASRAESVANVTMPPKGNEQSAEVPKSTDLADTAHFDGIAADARARLALARADGESAEWIAIYKSLAECARAGAACSRKVSADREKRKRKQQQA